jgi:hypothetical protein
MQDWNARLLDGSPSVQCDGKFSSRPVLWYSGLVQFIHKTGDPGPGVQRQWDLPQRHGGELSLRLQWNGLRDGQAPGRDLRVRRRMRRWCLLYRRRLLRISFVWHLQGLQYQRRWDLFA